MNFYCACLLSCLQLSTHIPAQTILAELAMVSGHTPCIAKQLNPPPHPCKVLDEEAEVFVVKLWRLLIYETEAKYLGIAKSY